MQRRAVTQRHALAQMAQNDGVAAGDGQVSSTPVTWAPSGWACNAGAEAAGLSNGSSFRESARMGRKTRWPVTAATRALDAAGAAYDGHLYAYEARGGTAISARELGVDEQTVVKTLVFETVSGDPLIVLMHGHLQVSAKGLARLLGVKGVAPCAPPAAQRYSGYQVGGTSPFGLRREMPIYAERTLFELPRIYINGGKRGFLVALAPDVLDALLSPERVDVGVPAL